MEWQKGTMSQKCQCIFCGYVIQPYAPCAFRERDGKTECAHLHCLKKENPEEFERLKAQP